MRCLVLSTKALDDPNDRHLETWLCRDTPYFREVARVLDANGVNMQMGGDMRITPGEAITRHGWPAILRLGHPELAFPEEVIEKSDNWWLLPEERDSDEWCCQGY